MGAVAIAIIIVIVVVSIVLGVYFSKKRCPKFGYKCPAPVVTPPPVADTPPPPAADTPPAVGTTRGETGKVEQGAASGREEVQDTRYMTNDEQMAYKKQQADLRDADGPALTNDQLAQLQRAAGKKVEITRDPALGQRINQQAGQAMGGKFEQAGQATMVEQGGMKDGLKGLSFNKQVGGKIAEAGKAQAVYADPNIMGGQFKVDGPGQASFAADKNAEMLKKMGFGGAKQVNNRAFMGGKFEQAGQATMVEMGGMKSGKAEQADQATMVEMGGMKSGKAEQADQATMVEMGGMKSGKAEQAGQATMVEQGGMKEGLKGGQAAQDPLSAYAAPQRGKDYSGTDVAKHRTNDPKKCAEYCTADQNCKFFVTSTNSQECWLKNNMGKSSNAGNRITYTKNGYLLPAAAENTADQTKVVVNKFGVGDAARVMGFSTVGGRTTVGRAAAAQGYGGR